VLFDDRDRLRSGTGNDDPVKRFGRPGETLAPSTQTVALGRNMIDGADLSRAIL
jgi:hypothetical protein